MAIYIVQDDGSKNFSQLAEFRTFVLTKRSFPLVGSSAEHVNKIKGKMKNFDPIKDSLVLVGDPINIGIAMSELLVKGGGYVLKWDNRNKKYVKIFVSNQ